MKLQDAYALFEENRKTYCSAPAVRNYFYTIGYFLEYCAAELQKVPGDVNVEDVDIHLLNRYSI